MAPGAVETFTATYTITQADVNAGRVSNTATANSDEGVTDVSDGDGPTTDGNGDTDPTNDPTVVPLTQNPQIDLVKTASVGGTGAVNDVITYTFTVTNTGDITLNNVEVTDGLIGLSAITPASVASMAPGAVETFTATYTITQADVNAGRVSNTATANSTEGVTDVSDGDGPTTDGDGDTDPTNDPTIVPLAQNPAIAVIKTGVRFDNNDDGAAAKDEVIEYTFTVSNTGNISLQSIELNDPLLGGIISGPISGDLNNDNILDVGESWIYQANYTLTQADVDFGSISNQASVKGDFGIGNSVQDLSDDNSNTEDDPTIIPLPQLPSIGLIKTSTFNDENSDGFAQDGETISYVFTVKNTGTVTLTNITIQDPLVSVQGGPLASLAPGQTNSTTFTATYVITQADIILGFFVNQATVFGFDPGSNGVSDLSDDQTVLKDNPTVTPLARKELFALIKTGAFRENDGDGISEAGEFIDYTFTVTNLGDMAIENIVINDPLLGGVVAGPSSGDTDSDSILDVNEVWIFNATYTLTQFDIDEAGVINQATLTGKSIGGTDLQDLSDDDSNMEDDPTVTPLVIGNKLELTKIGVFNDENGNGLADAGESITYFFTVTNTGSRVVFDIVVTDPLVSVSGNPIDLNPGESNGTEFSATYIITQDDINLGSVTNQAEADGRIDDGTFVNDTSDDPNDQTDNDLNGDGEPDDPTVILLPQSPAITLTKTGVLMDENGDGFSQVGETIRYTFTVTNTGNVDLFEVSITDPIVSVSGGILPSLTVGTSDSSTFTAIYVLTQNDIENGEVVNQATVNAMTLDSESISDLSDDPATLIENDPTIVPLLGDLIIYNGVSDNGDGSNDSFAIKGIERFPDNLVEIYNRWGVKVFDTKGYGSPGGKVFTGISDGRSTINKNEKLPEGTYFYVLKYKDGNGQNREKAGYLYINR
jgi:uncharacterized repeat protein (TIGR01451 family)/gliding motility-associated-like protein